MVECDSLGQTHCGPNVKSYIVDIILHMRLHVLQSLFAAAVCRRGLGSLLKDQPPPQTNQPFNVGRKNEASAFSLTGSPGCV